MTCSGDNKWPEYNHQKSLLSGRPIDKSGLPIPWYTYSAIEYVNSLDLKDCEIFEYGSGMGSMYWSRKSKSIISVESDPSWYKTGLKRIASNSKLILESDPNRYPEVINRFGKFDIVIIDGIERLECAKQSIKHLKTGGMIILDNSDWYKKTTKYLTQKSIFQVDYMGIGPVNRYMWATSFYYFNSKLNIPRKHAYPRPIGGIKTTSE